MNNLISHHRPLRFVGLLGLCLAAALFAECFLFISARAQTPCQIPPRLSANQAWPPGQIVNVYINPAGFTPEQLTTITNTISAWSNGNDNGVRFNVSSNPVSGNYSYTIRQQTPSIGAGAQAETGGTAVAGGNRLTAFSNINPGVSDLGALAHVVSHEIGHTFGLADCTTCAPNSSAMTLPTSANLNAQEGSPVPTACDAAATQQVVPRSCQPTTCPNRYQFDMDECRCVYAWEYTSEHRACPIILDVEGDGFSMTNPAGGVFFDFDNNGLLEKISWVAQNSDDAWLVLDRNGNFRIDGGAEMFGYTTPQPEPPPGELPNGFRALAVYDRPENGGDGNNWIDARDGIYPSLMLWQDKNHNGFAEPWELHPLSAFGVVSLSLDFKQSSRIDEHGNPFVWRSKVKRAQHSRVGLWAWDVSLQYEYSAPRY